MGNLDAKRDWGYAKEYVEAMWLMLQQEEPDDYVVATGETHSVRELLEEAFSYMGLDWRKHVEIDPRYYRPAEVDLLIGDPSKAKRKLGWEAKTKFKDLVRLMVDADMETAKKEAHMNSYNNSMSNVRTLESLGSGESCKVACQFGCKTGLIKLFVEVFEYLSQDRLRASLQITVNGRMERRNYSKRGVAGNTKRVVVTGGSGFLGSAVVDKLRARGYENIIVPRSSNYDLRDQKAIVRLYKDANPQVVIHLAAVVGGIGANRANPGRFFYDNAIMGIQMMEYARQIRR